MFAFLHGIHLLAVIIAVGGTFALRFVVLPRFEAEERDVEIRKAIIKRWRPIVWGNIVLIIITGLANTHHSFTLVGGDLWWYWILFSVKVSLAMILFAFALMMTLPMDGLSQVQSNWKRWLRHIFELGTIIVFLSAFLKFMHDALPGGTP